MVPLQWKRCHPRRRQGSQDALKAQGLGPLLRLRPEEPGGKQSWGLPVMVSAS